MADDGQASRACHISQLFPEVLTIIFLYLDASDKGRVAQVCRTWRDIVYNRQVWRGVTAKLHLRRANPSLFPSLVKRGIKKVEILSLRSSLRKVLTGIPKLQSLSLSGCFSVTDTGIGHALMPPKKQVPPENGSRSTAGSSSKLQEPEYLAVGLPYLTRLNLSFCKQITDSSVQRIVLYMPNLEVLELGGCTNITSRGLKVISYGLKNLRKLNLRSCVQISDRGIGYISGRSFNDDLDGNSRHGNVQLTHLILQDCQISDRGMEYISTGLINLKCINLSFCSNITNSALKFLSKMPSLSDINVRSCCNISDYGIGYLAQGGSKVTNLDVSFCEGIGDQSLVHISQGLYHLHSLSLCACNVSDEGIASFVRNINELHTLNIGQCSNITDKGLALIAEHLQEIQCIDLYGCTKITTVGLEKIMALSKLTTLNLGLWHRPQKRKSSSMGYASPTSCEQGHPSKYPKHSTTKLI